GWPQLTGNMIYSSPALGDIDNDGKLEIVAGSYDGKVYVWKSNGAIVPGWPQLTNDSVHSSPALGDIDNDGKLEIAVGSKDKKMYVWRNNGTAAIGWPKYAISLWSIGGGEIYSSSAMADIDNDNKLEIAMGSYNSYVYLENDDWTRVPGWPQLMFISATGKIQSSPALGDIDNDGLSEMIFGIDKYVFVFELQGTINPLKLDWPMLAHDARHTGLYIKNCDNVLNSQCSPTKPLFCNNGALANKCSVCGCTSGLTCSTDGSCKTVSTGNTPKKPPTAAG
ncbi:MAG: VCBS repeat-containing protein, partial [Candidatus Aenigmatarchaeota archaeon]